MYQISGGTYGQSANYCSATFVQGAATLSTTMGGMATTTFQTPPQSGDSILAGCLGQSSPQFTITDNNGNIYNAISSFPISPAPTYLLGVTQIASSQSQSFTVTCSDNDSGDFIDAFALEYDDLGVTGSPPNYNLLIDSVNMNGSRTGVSPFSCGGLPTTEENDLTAILYNYFVEAVPGDGPLAPGRRSVAPDSDEIAPLLGIVPACPGGQGGECVSYNVYNNPESGGVSVYPQNSPDIYTPAWTSPLYCPYMDGCVFPMSCSDAALEVIGP